MVPVLFQLKEAKETVSARNYIPTAFVGFMVNTGFAHGGNGFESVEFLLNVFDKVDMTDPGDSNLKFNLTELANITAKEYREYKKNEQDSGKMEIKRIPCVNHPVFKGHDVNIDPRENFVKKELDSKGIYNVFLDFYHKLVVEMFHEGATKNIFCVNVDAVLSVITLNYCGMI